MRQETISKQEAIKEKLNALKANGQINYWTLSSHNLKRNNIYIEKNYQVESILEANRAEYDITIFKQDGKNTYKSSFTLTPNSTNEEIEKQLNNALFTCNYAKAPQYTLPDKNDPLLDDTSIDYSQFFDEKTYNDIKEGTINFFLEKQLQNIKTLIENYNSDEVKVTLNNLELLTTAVDTSFENSQDNTKSFQKDKTYLEFVLSAKHKDAQHESEHIIYEHINSLYDFDFTSFFEQAIKTVIDTTKSTPAPQFSGSVILKDVAIQDFFTPDLTMNSFIGHASAKLKYDQISQYEIGNQIITPQKDTLTIYSNPLLPKNEQSIPYDGLGICAKKVCLINNNTLENFFASKQYAHYLNIEPTGPLGVIEVETGKNSIENLEQEDNQYVEIHTFSSFVPDLASGSFSAEIRLGYLVKDGVKTPFKGGLFSGNIFELLANCRLSQEELIEAGYKGPKAIKFYEGQIIGE